MNCKHLRTKSAHSFLWLMAVLLLPVGWSGTAFGQAVPTYSSPTGSSGNAFPFSTTSSNRVQGLYMPSQFTPGISAGNITDVYFYVNGAGSNVTYTNVTISIGMTNITTLSTGAWNTGLTQAYFAASLNIPSAPAGTWVRFPLQTPVFWDGISNLIVDASQQGMSGSGFTVNNWTSPYNGRLYGAYNAATGTAGTQLAQIGFNMAPAGPCTSPPTAGTATASSSNVCQGSSFSLNLTGNSLGQGQTYQWESATSPSGPWTPVSTAANTSFYNATATSTLYYRAAVTCGTATAYSTSVLVTVPALFPAGTYTINSAVPTGGTNFQTFSAAAAAISCGISGHVIFNVAPGSGPYNEQVSIPAFNSSPTKTVTFNCNNTTLTYTNTTNTANYAVLRLDGADYIRFNKLNVTPGGTTGAGTYGFGIMITNNADNNIVDSCTVTIAQSVTSSNFAGISIGGSSTSFTAGTVPCDSNIVSNCSVSGGYYATTCVGTSGNQQFNNQWLNNTIADFYFYGHYMAYNTGEQFVGNDINRALRTTTSTFYGIYMTTGNLKSNIGKNRIHNAFTSSTPTTNSNSAYGIYHGSTATAGNENVMSNNLIYNLEGTGAHYIMYSAGAYARWYHNTVSEDYQGAASGTTYLCYIISSYAGLEYRNNNISLTRAGTGSRYIVYHSSTGYPVIHNNNNYYVSGAANNVGYYGGTTTPTLATWQTASGKDAASMSVNPNFFAPNAGDFTPTNLAMDNLGAPGTGITTDFYNITRNTTAPDAGAVEFNYPCSTPTNLAATNLLVNGATVSWNLPAVTGGAQYAVTTSATPPAAGTLTSATTVAVTGLAAATQYYLHVRNRCGSATFSPWVSIPFTTCTQATITPLSALIFCSGSNVTLTANPGTSYVWSLNGSPITGATSSAYTTATAGNYTVKVTDAATGCVVTSAPAQVQVGTPPANITPSGAVTACPGVGAQLAAISGVGYTYQWKLNGNNIPGATSSTYTAMTPGNYTVFVASSPTCSATTTSPTTVTFNPVTPASIAPPQYTAVCPGSTITLNANTGNSLAYQWQMNGTDIPGATSPTYTGSGVGTYTVKVTSITTGCTAASAPLSISAATAPTASISSPTQITACDTAVLTANAGPGYTYQWIRNGSDIPGATGQTYGASQSGNYVVRVINNAGCGTLSSAVAATVNPSPVGIITYSAPLVFCQGSAVVLNAFTEPNILYQWLKDGSPIPGASGASFTVDQSGIYAISMTNQYGCNKVTTTVPVTVLPLPNPVINFNGTLLATGNFASYQWFFNNQPIPGATGATYTPTQRGAYKVEVTDANGCTNTSQILFVNTLGVAQTARTGGDLQVYPNPANAYVTIENKGRIRMTGVAIVNSLGAVVYQAEAEAQKLTVQTGMLPAGIYTLRIQTENGTINRKLELLK